MGKRTAHRAAPNRPASVAAQSKPEPPQQEEDYFGMRANDEKIAKIKAALPKVEAELRTFWRIGRTSLDKQPAYPRGANNQKSTEARALGWNPEKLRQARLFAHLCSEEELGEKIKEAYRYSYPPHWTVLVKIYQVTDIPQRDKIWNSCINCRLSHHALAAHIRAINLTNDHSFVGAGRNMIAPRSTEDARQRLWHAAKQLLRLHEVCRPALQPDGLPPDVRRALARTVKALTELKAALPTATKPQKTARRKGRT